MTSSHHYADDPSTASNATTPTGAPSDGEMAAADHNAANLDTTQQSQGAVPVDVRGGGVGSAWVTVVIGALLLIMLLVFVLQNQSAVDIAFLGWQFSMPTGVVILFAAIIGALVMALLAAMRIFQLRRRASKASKGLRR